MRMLLVLLVVASHAFGFAPGHARADQLPPGIISATDAQAMLAKGEIVLLDIRSPGEWKETGVPAGAKMVTVHRRDFLAAVLKVTGGDKSKPIALICAIGGRSAMARRFLAKHGFTNVIDVSEGMLGNHRGPGWIRRGQPVLAYSGN